jgi:hypothetical protein
MKPNAGFSFVQIQTCGLFPIDLQLLHVSINELLGIFPITTTVCLWELLTAFHLAPFYLRPFP